MFGRNDCDCGSRSTCETEETFLQHQVELGGKELSSSDCRDKGWSVPTALISFLHVKCKLTETLAYGMTSVGT
jgi:hypothetical protein